MAVLDIQDLKVHYYTLTGIVRAVDGVSLSVNKGEWISIVGESGSGKSTLALSIPRLIMPPGRIVGGRILYSGVDLLSLAGEELRRYRGREIGMVFQDPTAYLDPYRTVGSQIAESLLEHGLASSGSEAESMAGDALELVGIPRDRASVYPHQLSGGQRQRVAIAAAVALEPKILIADEPTTALDVVVQAKIMDLMKKLQEERGLTVMLVTHDIGLAAEYSDRIAVMYAGELVEIGPAEDVVSNPIHPYTEMLIKSVPDPWEDREVKPIPGSPPDLRNPPPGCRFHPRCPLRQPLCTNTRPSLRMVDGGRGHSCLVR
ncbi:dipeptide ABC transporter, ATP-binding protein DppD [Aeropyrum pernix K1]|uniref:Nickel import system ATP-binding protein NikD n=1 Tax=Aeropyrum pernix (strain ATCC 700893 / DSM 11879 / JCM 9820 / NBRC 100138 / K1) TaxID=272557 RepID=Q9Y9M7_AERPE|nr:ABC transporter ATP-binding protein [Aeropyrum pernix]BAA81273.2 dipeptide ABC transporter, ATP-binding protein DppD [Aeropyrum pernix K1]